MIEQWFEVSYVKEAGDTLNDPPIYNLGVGYFRSPDISGETVCKSCGHIMHKHGWIDKPNGGETVCPGNYVYMNDDGESIVKNI